MKQKRYFLMDIKDKTKISKKNCCPPHHFPHTLPIIGELVTNEPCHFHKAKWRMKHHVSFCKFLNCTHYKKMMISYNKWKNKNETNH